MDECELITFISVTACAISKCCSTDEITLLSVIFTQLGDSLATILAKRSLISNNDNENNTQESKHSIVDISDHNCSNNSEINN